MEFGTEAPFSQRPLGTNDIPTVIAILAILPAALFTVIEIGKRLLGFESKSLFASYAFWAFCGSALWLCWHGVVRRVRGRRRDRCLDVMGWLFPEMTVFEVSGVHFIAFGWIANQSNPVFRVVLLTQNCHRGARSLQLELNPKFGCYLPGEGPFSFRVLVGDAGVVVSTASRPVPTGQAKGLFELKASVRVDSAGSRVRFRRGFSLENPHMEAAKAIAMAHSPLHAAIALGTERNKPEAPVVMERTPELDDIVWPEPGDYPVWNWDAAWQLTAPAVDLLTRLSLPLMMQRQGKPPPDFNSAA